MEMLFSMNMMEAKTIGKNELAKISSYHEKGIIKSVVFVADSIESAQNSAEIRQFVGENVLQLGKIDKTEAVKIVRSRIGNLAIISDNIIELIAQESETPRELLKNTEDVLRSAVESEAKKVTREKVRTILSK